MPFHTVHRVLKARILKWLSIPFSSGPHSIFLASTISEKLKFILEGIEAWDRRSFPGSWTCFVFPVEMTSEAAQPSGQVYLESSVRPGKGPMLPKVETFVRDAMVVTRNDNSKCG